MSTVPDIHLTIGAALIGCVVAVGTCLLLFLVLDQVLTCRQVAWIWLVDSAHTVLICTAVWHYAIDNFANPAATAVVHPLNINFNLLPPSGFALNSIMTVNITFSVNLFYLSRIHKCSLTYSKLSMACAKSEGSEQGQSVLDDSYCPALLLPSRYFSALLFKACLNSTYQWWLIPRASSFRARFKATTFLKFLPHKAFLIATLSISACTEMIIVGSRWYFLRCIREGHSMWVLSFIYTECLTMAHADRPHEAVDAILVFTVNDGIMTCAVVLGALICFITMPHYWIFAAFFFSIAKVSGNSLLATLNLRNRYRYRHVEPHARNIPMLPRGQFSDEQYPSLSSHKQVQVTVSTHQQVQISDQKPGLDDIPVESVDLFLSS
ncbi:hypothetical protein C8R45DRAFT_928669 [Mycena sanguinolenta]|nr:hypothetical protein C8R45DRAFT_928669 [Mycena sanguinolenta]